MRLINTRTLKFKEFSNTEQLKHKYAILSHRWIEDQEVSYVDFLLLTDQADLDIDFSAPRTLTWLENKKRTSGYAKILRACEQALSDGNDYIWIDTCCIDRKSSAELSESINSMWTWYLNSKICYAYLGDVACTDQLSSTDSQSSFERSQWFTRGWTLQELLAPPKVRFYDQHWNLICERYEESALISRLTNIDEYYLLPQSWLGSETPPAYISTKMTWAANRTTSRPEDMAYCLLGLFGVNMPLLYGEGFHRAFQRLQKELLARPASSAPDETIFAHAHSTWSPTAVHPKEFLRYRDLQPYTLSLVEEVDTLPWTITNVGIQYRAALVLLSDEQQRLCGSYRVMALPYTATTSELPVLILLFKLSGTGGVEGRYAVCPNTADPADWSRRQSLCFNAALATMYKAASRFSLGASLASANTLEYKTICLVWQSVAIEMWRMIRSDESDQTNDR
jgi:hypothetical protein